MLTRINQSSDKSVAINLSDDEYQLISKFVSERLFDVIVRLIKDNIFEEIKK